MDPANINAPIAVLNRDLGTTSDPAHLIKRKAVGSLSFESFGIKADGTMIYGDELAPSGGAAGGGIYKFVPASPFSGGGQIFNPAASPFASGAVFGLRVAAPARPTGVRARRPARVSGSRSILAARASWTATETSF
jgi:hypothetical protein